MMGVNGSVLAVRIRRIRLHIMSLHMQFIILLLEYVISQEFLHRCHVGIFPNMGIEFIDVGFVIRIWLSGRYLMGRLQSQQLDMSDI